MKWSIPQLKKIQKFPFSFSETIDYKDAIKHVSDILDIDLVKVDGKNNTRIGITKKRGVY